MCHHQIHPDALLPLILFTVTISSLKASFFFCEPRIASLQCLSWVVKEFQMLAKSIANKNLPV